MPEDWSDLRGQHDRDLRKRSDDRIQALEDSRDRGPEPRRDHGYSGNGIQRFLWILVGGLVSLAFLGVAGGIVMYRQIGVHEKWLEGLQHQVDKHEQREHRERR